MYASQAKIGFVSVALSAVIWGLAPLFYAELKAVKPIEILAHRIIWTVILMMAYLWWLGKLYMLFTAFKRFKNLKIIFFTSLLATINWGGFIWAIYFERVVEASFGYYIMPLFAVLLGAIFLGERHNMSKWIAIGLAVLGVVMVAIALNAVPWLALLLASSFAIYGLLKTSLKTHPLISVTIEAFLVMPFALVYLIGLHIGMWSGFVDSNSGNVSGASGVFGDAFMISFLLILSGVITGMPLVLFAYGARRMTYGATGLISYITPSLQFVCAVFLLKEDFLWWHFGAFSLIWAALAIYSYQTMYVDEHKAKITP